MDNNLNEVILDKLTKTCRCRAISRAKIKEAIKNGAFFSKKWKTKHHFYFYLLIMSLTASIPITAAIFNPLP